MLKCFLNTEFAKFNRTRNIADLQYVPDGIGPNMGTVLRFLIVKDMNTQHPADRYNTFQLFQECAYVDNRLVCPLRSGSTGNIHDRY